ncbi:MAG: hypothetical protein R2777_01615 [Chitinophagales bacterium]
MQNVLNFNAHSTEMDSATPYPVIDIMESQKNIDKYGGTMRLGQYECKMKKILVLRKKYNETTIQERHHCRYEFNNQYLVDFENAGMEATGINHK